MRVIVVTAQVAGPAEALSPMMYVDLVPARGRSVLFHDLNGAVSVLAHIHGGHDTRMPGRVGGRAPEAYDVAGLWETPVTRIADRDMQAAVRDGNEVRSAIHLADDPAVDVPEESLAQLHALEAVGVERCCR